VLDCADGKAITHLTGAVDEPPIAIEDRIPEHLRPPEERRGSSTSDYWIS
jgi:hypothetical protein